MKRSIILIALLIAIGLSVSAQTALDVIKKADEKNRGESSKGEMSMTIERSTWSRTVTMKAWSKGTNYFMLYITSPAKEKGQVFLKRGNEMWNWVPSIERMIKIPPSMMMQSWMGSDFTNDDLVQQSSIVKDYKHNLLGKEVIRGKECFKIELIPNDDAPVVWGKIISWITVDGYDQWSAQYFDEDMELVNTENAYDIKKMGDRIIPTRIEIIPADEKGNKTILQIISMEFNIAIDETFFSQQNMKKVR
ncbi:outer membrane lipoprotein-sorting protein [Bacteroidota bacterium]